MRDKNERLKRLRIVEAGAGFGAACEGILTFFKQFNPFILNFLQYDIVEISGLACE
jgi:SAM-dependent MidA family methyltransferase